MTKFAAFSLVLIVLVISSFYRGHACPSVQAAPNPLPRWIYIPQNAGPRPNPGLRALRVDRGLNYLYVVLLILLGLYEMKYSIDNMISFSKFHSSSICCTKTKNDVRTKNVARCSMVPKTSTCTYLSIPCTTSKCNSNYFIFSTLKFWLEIVSRYFLCIAKCFCFRNTKVTNPIPTAIMMIIIITVVTIIIINGFEINEEACLYLLFTLLSSPLSSFYFLNT